MSTKTFFKRAALVAIASLGFGLVTVPSSQAAITASSITLGAATATATVGDTATGSWTLRYTYDTSSVVGVPAAGGMDPETVIVKFSCEAPTGATCPALQARQTQTADTSNIVSAAGRDGGSTPSTAPWINITGNTWGETPTNTGVANSIRSAVSFKAVNFTRAGTYTYTIFGVAGATKATITSLSTTWTVTVSAANTSVASVNSYFAPTNAQASYYRQTPSGVPNASSTDSGIVTSMGTAATPVAAGVLYMVPFNSAGDSLITLGDTRIPVQDTVVVTLTGPGYISTAGAAATGKAISALSISAFGTSQATGSLITGVGYATESVVVWSDGTAGTGTITVTKGSATLLTKTITFTGNPASAGVALSDTYTSIGQTLNLVAQVKDSGGNILTNGTLYVFSSDTTVVSAGASLYSNAATQYQTLGRCTSTWNVTAKTLSCALTTADTGTASIYLADSWNVTASSFVTTALTLTVTGNTIASATVAFNKATYAPGERAVITITSKDSAARVLATGATGSFTRIEQTPTLSGVVVAPYFGTGGTTDRTSLTTLSVFDDTGVETRVVTMPTYTTDVTYSVVVPGFGVAVAATTVSATAKVVNPVDTTNAAAVAAAQSAADAATDAALEAIDAANAATDAANLAAEAADAATVAAEEARDAADAATAAVEALATEVATLMAALKAQITTLARTVAKIAKKVNA